MGTFNINQIQLGKNLYLIPNADGCNIDLIPVGEANNWECVDDPIINPDDDTTYVHSNATNLLYDLYELPNHTTETGTINYVQVLARGRSHIYAQHKNGIYKIIETDNNCANIYKSDDFNLITVYNEYKEVWTTNPRTDADWTWDDIDNLQIGIECSSPTVSGFPVTSTFRPSGIGDVTQLDLSSPIGGNNWQAVDEAISDSYWTHVFQRGACYDWDYDLYNIPNHTTEAGIITSVVIFAVCTRSATDDDITQGRLKIKTGGTEFTGTDNNFTLNDEWIRISETWTDNPDTLTAWTWANIDNLQIGIELYFGGTTTSITACTQLYMVVHYLTDVNPQIRTTQCYAKINYNTEVDCTFDKPEVISVDHNQNIKMLNFWSGNRAVYGLARSNRTMVMTGKLYSNDACTKIECVRLMAESGGTVNLSGLSSRNYDRAFRILSFGWRKLSDKPLAYNWIMELEYE